MALSRDEPPPQDASGGLTGLSALAAEAYVHGCPLVFGVSMVAASLSRGFGPLPATPFNTFAHATEPAGPEARFVSVNNDTVYSIAQLDLSGGPVLLHVPAAGPAYHVLQFVDVWSNNFAYLGKRATGGAGGDWLISPPGWAGSAPAGVRGVIDAPTSVVTIVGRWAYEGPRDMPRVRALQEQLMITRLDPAAHRSGLPGPEAGVPEELIFFERLRVLMADFPPSPADQEYEARFQPLGLLEEGPSPYAGAAPELVRALTEGQSAGRARVEEASRRPAGDSRPGDWSLNAHLFDYNLDHLGIGTIDSVQWRIPDRVDSYLARAVAARIGLWGNHGYEAVYAQTFTDSGGRRLNGSHSYTLRFDRPPPVAAFWSVTMYDTPHYYLVENPARRYSIGDRTPGLVYGEDGSLTLVLQRRRPADPAEAANWLPAPEGDFRPMIRLYMPGEPVLDGTYRLPRIEVRDG
ncbi:DUF1254 domain-containing protein [Streptomyces sp. CAU 1734]|uniref:DUF1254 domain-containing protein n=1 Tax=Streptomyces sp. CAU 1734 TaxID=3140360 RepID=UPI0032605CC2